MQFEGIDRVVKSKRKSIALEISQSGEVLLRVPRFMPQILVGSFVKKHQAWINKKKMEFGERRGLQKQFISGEKFLFLGVEYELDLVDGKSLDLEDSFKLGRDSKYAAREMFEKWYKQEFRKIAEDRLPYWSDLGGYKYKRLRVSGAKTRWGSCSTTGTISLVWRLVMAPMAIIDYVILHELAHTIHMNHSRKFWAEVEKYMPDYKKRRKWLRENGVSLNIG